MLHVKAILPSFHSQTFCDVLIASLVTNFFQMGSSLKKIFYFLASKFLSFRIDSIIDKEGKMKKAEVLPLRVYSYSFTLRY